MPMATETFRLSMTFPKGPHGDPKGRRRLELAAKDKIMKDVRGYGYEPQETSFRAEWSSPFQGEVTIIGILPPKPGQ